MTGLAAGLLLVLAAGHAQADVASPGCRTDFDHDHPAWAQVLRSYVKDGWVDYGRLVSAGRPALSAYQAVLEAICPAAYHTWSRQQRLAYWINAYNAYTVQLIVEHYPVKSIRSIGLLPQAAFRTPFIRLPAHSRDPISLNQIEHGILRAQFHEPRIHFAIVCASRGCPVLQSEPYRARQIEGQLATAARRFIGDQSKNRFDGTRRTLALSSIFKWFREDFDREPGGLVAFVQRLAPAALAAQIAANPGVNIEFLPYDWDLNGS